MKTANRILSFVLIAILVLALLPVGVGFAEGIPVESDGYDPAAEIATWVRFRNFKNGGGAEAYVSALNGGLTGHDFSWKTPTSSNPFTFSYSAGVLSLQVNGADIVSRSIGDLGPLNYIKLDVVNNANRATVHLNSLTVDGIATIPHQDFQGNGWKRWNVTGIDLSSGFVLAGEIYLAGRTQPDGELNMVEIGVGYLAPPDTFGPEVSAVTVNGIDVAYLNAPATLEALVDDTNTGGSNILSAEYSLNGGAWLPMDPQDGAFDSPIEWVKATFTATQLGENTVCVRGTDVEGNLGDEECAIFSVHYVFDGFFDPIDVTIVNEAKAGQNVPAKWRLTDGLNVPISDPNSFIGISSYQVSCTDYSGDIAQAVDEYAPGTSGLQYNEDGYWQYNWKTPKSYSGTCRVFFVKFNSGQYSAGARFAFK